LPQIFDESGWAAAAVIFAATMALALAAQFVVGKLLKRLSYRLSPGMQSVTARTRRLAHLAFFLAAAAVALPLAPLDATTTAAVQRVLGAAVILLAGWAVTIAIHIASDRYLGGLDLAATDNLEARRAATQIRVLRHIASGLVVVVAVGLALMSFDSVRQYGISLFASAGVVGIIVGLAAQSTIGNLLAGVQLALTQPIRLDDVLVVEGEFGNVEEINSTFVVLRLWDWRRLVVPLKYFLEKPFQNWTRTSASVIGSVLLYADYRVPVEAMRGKLEEIARASPLWDGKVLGLQVTNCRESCVELRALVSAADASRAWDLRCHVREQLVAYLQQHHSAGLPRWRVEPMGSPASVFPGATENRTP
jgi:small-conductance mechanosensitive channel